MKKTITFIGNGSMATAIAKTLKENYTIEVVGRNLENLDRFEAAVGTDVTKHLLNDFDITGKTLLLCVKPANIEEVGAKLRGKAEALYSVLAGTKVETIKRCIGSHGTVRAMPNLAASVGRSMTTLTGDRHLESEAVTIFNAIGMTLWVSSEKELDIATALAGSGPAYLCLVAEALADGAVKQGLRRDDAMTLMRGLFAGFGELIQDQHPALLKDGVMSPGGTTAAGYSALESASVRRGFISAVEHAYKRALEL